MAADVGNPAPPHGSQAGAPLSWTSERADMRFVGERVRKVAANRRQPQRAERAISCGPSGGVLPFASDDEAADSRTSERSERAIK